ncbi:MAG: hypothetical protein QM754_18645 [Tepidisphaeraceae bacterium]
MIRTVKCYGILNMNTGKLSEVTIRKERGMVDKVAKAGSKDGILLKCVPVLVSYNDGSRTRRAAGTK